MSSIICSLILLSITVQLIMDKEIMSTVTNRTNEPLVLVSEQPTNTHKSISLVVNEISSIDLDLAFQMFGNIILDRDHKTFSNKSNNASFIIAGCTWWPIVYGGPYVAMHKQSYLLKITIVLTVIFSTCCKIFKNPIKSTNDPPLEPTYNPTGDPTIDSTYNPTSDPTIDPTTDATSDPTFDPTVNSTYSPTGNPTLEPKCPTKPPTLFTLNPSLNLSNNPTTNPTQQPSNNPTIGPTNFPSYDPTNRPAIHPTSVPTINPTYNRTLYPTFDPTVNSTCNPTGNATINPTLYPSIYSTSDPTINPTYVPVTNSTIIPTIYPTKIPTTNSTTQIPSFAPSDSPTSDPTDFTASQLTILIRETYIPTQYNVTDHGLVMIAVVVSTLAIGFCYAMGFCCATNNRTNYPTETPSIFPTNIPTNYLSDGYDETGTGTGTIAMVSSVKETDSGYPNGLNNDEFIIDGCDDIIEKYKNILKL